MFLWKTEATSDALSAWIGETLHSIKTEENSSEWCGVNRNLNTVPWHTGGYENMENMIEFRK